jgi:hypothetical protein
MSPQEELSAKDIMLMFLDKTTYEKRHEELQTRMSILENKFDGHIVWANQTLQVERKTTNDQFTDVHRKISGKLEAINTKLDEQQEKFDKRHREEVTTKVGWVIALSSPVVLVVLEYFFLRR